MQLSLPSVDIVPPLFVLLYTHCLVLLDPKPDIPLTPILEGFVILKKNPDSEQ